MTGIIAPMPLRTYAQQSITGPYLMAFHACDSAATNCREPRNHRTYLAQSADGAAWSIVAGWVPFNGSVPDVIQRGNTLYIYTPGQLSRYHLDTNRLDAPVPVTVTGLSAGFVDPSLIVDEQGRLVMFYLHGQFGGDPAACLPSESSCLKHFGSAVEVAGSDGSQFTADSGDRAQITLQPTGALRTASDPDIFFDGGQYILYISQGPSTSVWMSAELRGTYTRVTTLPNGLLNENTGGIASGHFDNASRRYWTYSHTQVGGTSVIRRAVHANFSRQLSESDWTTVVSGTSVGLTATTNVESPSFATFSAATTPAALNFSLTDRGAVTRSTTGASGTLQVGYGRIQPNSGSTTPAGLAIFGLRQSNVLVTEAGVPASPLVQTGRIAAQIGGAVNTGLAIANPNNQAATISFYFTDGSGDFGQGTTTIPANGQIAAFLNQSPFNGRSSVSGTFTLTASAPVAVVALRGFTNERSEFLITTLPVTDLSVAASIGPIVLPHFADGAGWTTEILLVNPTDSALPGTIQFVDQSGNAATLTANGQTANSFSYSIPARAGQRLTTGGSMAPTLSGSVRIAPSGNGTAPAALAVFSFKRDGITVAEAGVPAIRTGSAFRLYAEASGDFDRAEVGSMQTGVAITNLSNAAAAVTLELTRLDGSSTGLTGSITVPANGQAAQFLGQIQGFTSLSLPFQGVLRISSAASISVIGLRGRYNERNDFLITTTPPINEATATTNAELIFPHFADGAGYTTQFILFSGSSGQQSGGSLRLYSQSGQSLTLTMTEGTR